MQRSKVNFVSDDEEVVDLKLINDLKKGKDFFRVVLLLRADVTKVLLGQGKEIGVSRLIVALKPIKLVQVVRIELVYDRHQL